MRILNRIITTASVFLILVLFGCCRRTDCSVLPSFCIKNLQDSLDSFISTVDSFPNPYGPTVYTAAFCLDESDTLLCLSAYGYLLQPGRFDKQGNWYRQGFKKGKGIGARMIGDRVLAINTYGIDSLPSIVNYDAFDIGLYQEEADRTNRILSMDHPWDGWEPIPSERYYKLIGRDSLLFLTARYSIYE